MSFTSFGFFLFFPAVFLLYRIIPLRLRRILLLAASFLFYAWGEPLCLLLLLFITFISWNGGRILQKTEAPAKRRRIFLFSAGTCLFVLFVFKYLPFAVKNLSDIVCFFGWKISFPSFSLLLPMGISFYTFQSLSYLIDVFQKRIKPETNFGIYALYLSFFPQLVAGPIERPNDLIPQLKNPRPPAFSDLSNGMRFFLTGYAKKFLIADFIAPFVDTAFSSPEKAGGAGMLFAAILFAVQIYCDFSGYCDIACGCASFLGIRLSENFHFPYHAASVREFWHRWHITLTKWFTDYIYIPLGGNRKGILCQCRNILLTFLASGLWHGAGWNYVIWGGLHGIFLIAETLAGRLSVPCRKFFHPFEGRLPRLRHLLRTAAEVIFAVGKSPGRLILRFRQIRTFLLVCFAWIFFRAENLSQAFLILKVIVHQWEQPLCFFAETVTYKNLLILLLLSLLLPLLKKLPAEKSSSEAHILPLYFLLSLSIILCRCLLLQTQGDSAFIYFRF